MLSIGFSQNCCGVGEICNLRDHKSPREAMIQFCKSVYGRNDYDYRTGRSTFILSKRANLRGMYMFAGVVKHTDGSEDRYHGFDYGPKFAEFIKKEGLGEVVESKVAPNRGNHPKHVIKAWIWTPAPRKVGAWHRKHVAPLAEAKTPPDDLGRVR